MAGGAAAVAGLGVALTKGFGRLTAIENARAKLSGLGNDAETVEAIMTNALDAVKGTAFGMDEAATVAAQVVASGIKPGKELEGVLRLVGDAATIAGTDMSSMGAVFGKVAASGKIQGDTIAQLADMGIPIVQMLAEELGVSAEETYKLASEGKINFETFRAAMEDGLGGAAAKSGETLQGAFKNSMAAIGRFGANLLEGVYPKIKEFFNAFQGWMGPVEELGKVIGERLGQALVNLGDWLTGTALPALRDFGDWVRENREPITLVATAVAGLMAGFALYQTVMGVVGWVKNVAGAIVLLNAALLANPIMLVVAAIGALVGAAVWAYNNVTWFRDGVNAAWAGIQKAIAWAWENVIQPVFRSLSDFITNTLIPVVTGFWQNVIQPVFGWIGERIKGVWEGVIRPTFLLMHDILHRVLIPIIRAFWEKHIRPTFEKVGGFIRDTWNNIIKPVFDALGRFITEHVAPKIERGVQIIGDVWTRLKKLFAEPINWVINTVWNNGLKKAFDGVAEAVGSTQRLGRIAPIPMGDASRKGNSRGTGGVTTYGRRAAGGNVREGKPYLVGEFGPEFIFPDRDGYVATARETAKMLAAGQDLDPSLARKAAGRNPREAMAPMGDGFNWGAAGNYLKDQLGLGRLLGTDQLAAGVGQLGDFAKGILDPLLGQAKSYLGGFGRNGQLAMGAASKAAKMVVDWALGKDKAATAGGVFGGDYTGDPSGFFRPVGGSITSRFGRRWGGIHSGIDLAVPIGTAVRAAWNGVVQKAGWNALTGRTGMGMILGHGGGRQTYYGHLSGFTARPGQTVRAGQTIARSGNTGRSTGPHLHFEELMGGRAVNPGYLFRDQGGNLPPGLSMVLNKTGSDEWIFNKDQLGKLDSAVRGGTGMEVNFNGNIGYDPREITAQIDMGRKRAMLAAGIG
nr:peptidoglycan DD-metalloendopeptidase family protein [Micrococcus sp. TA1]